MKKVVKVERSTLEKFSVAQATKVKAVLADDFKDVELVTIAAVIMSSVEVCLTMDSMETGVRVDIIDKKPSNLILPEKPSLIVKR